MVSCVYSELLDPRAAVTCEGAHRTGFSASPSTPRGKRDRTDGPAVARSADDIRPGDGRPRNRRRTAYGRAQRRFARVRSRDASASRWTEPVAAAGPPQLAADGARCIARTDGVAAGSGDAGGRIVGRRSGRTPIRAQDFTHINIGVAHMACNISIGFGQAAFDRLLGACSNMFPDREQINELSSRTPTQWVEGSAVVRTGHKQIPPRASPSFGMT